MGGLDQEANDPHLPGADIPALVFADEHPDDQSGITTILEYWFDADSRPCTVGEAVTGEIVELVGGFEVKRTYVDLRETTKSLEVPALVSDADPENQDALKNASWDLWSLEDDGQLVPVTTLEQLLRTWGIDGLPLPQQRTFVANMMGLPMWVPAPAELRAEVNDWLLETRQE